ncbi:ABC transporter ATP-binding protein [Actinoplanes couchii]|uniref:ABC transporter n=1 Tax=Actinoplanes couchii TaxID=403638 RepID=A0ABQ3XQD8_9ACTN|nr:ABC transporter ATP-binding protein [Actinoplanes couchii]MDR6317435.1 ATP-binding cassette subfamily B protein [Actinoplanes couchii]GID60736.1 ABC transporter [Actinoplanes couchii]
MIRRLSRVLGAPYARPLRMHLAGLIVYAILQGLAFVLIVPVLRPLLRGDVDAALPWVAVLAGTVVACAAAYWIQAQLGYRLGTALSQALHHRIGDHLAALPLGWFTPARVGRVARMSSTGVVDIMGVPAHLLAPLVTSYVTPAVVVFAMIFLDWRLAVATLVAVPLVILVFRWTARLFAATDHAVDAAGVEAANRVVEFAQNQAVLRAHGRSDFDQLEAALLEQRAAGRKQLLRAVPGLAAAGLVVQALVTIVLITGVYLATSGPTVDAAALIALLVLTVRFAEPLMAAAELGAAVRMAGNSLARVDELLATPVLPEPATAGTFTTPGTIELDGVGFGYDSRPVLRDVSLRVPARSVTALVGASGSGKTTVVRLVARFFDTRTGVVRVGGADVRDLTTEQLMSQISVVFQDVYLFDAGIADNIRAGRADATDAEVAAAAALARVDEIADRLPDGYDTRVGEGGARLSGGERQRISIARAILKDAPIVLLDEATAALDQDNEAAITAALTALSRDRTLLVIAHRLRTVQSADQIVVLADGGVAESGTHEELLLRNGQYAHFWNERSRARGWRLTPA